LSTVQSMSAVVLVGSCSILNVRMNVEITDGRYREAFSC
jgi:hypothetical protein